MNSATLPLLLISGPVGVGKSSIANEVSNLLNGAGISHSQIDLDALAETYPRPPGDRFHSTLALANLGAVWANCAAAGARNLIIPRVIESRDEVRQIEQAVPGALTSLGQLRARDATLLARVRTRERGAGRDWHEARALELARSLAASGPADFIVQTDDRTVPDIAAEIFRNVQWQGA